MNRSVRQPSCVRRQPAAPGWQLLLLLALILFLPGCLVIEKKNLVLVIPSDSREVRMYYVFEGISVLNHKDSSLERATGELNNLKKPDLGFFASGGGNSDLLQLFRFDDLRFFVDATRKRQLCADRLAFLVDRDRLARMVNKQIRENLKVPLGRSMEKIQEDLRDFSKTLGSKETIRQANEMGIGPMLKVVRGLVQICTKFDTASLERLKAASQEDFRWLRFEEQSICLVLPATRECAQRIVEDPDIVAWVTDMQELVEPLSVAVKREGLVIVVGRSPIHLTYTDTRPYRPVCEENLIKNAGSPQQRILQGKPASAKDLIKQFLAEARKKS